VALKRRIKDTTGRVEAAGGGSGSKCALSIGAGLAEIFRAVSRTVQTVNFQWHSPSTEVSRYQACVAFFREIVILIIINA
jgi:hypothetical protein